MTGYKVSHNATGSVLLSQTSYTTFVVESAVPGVYHFTVFAFNVLGNGKEANVTGYVLTKFHVHYGLIILLLLITVQKSTKQTDTGKSSISSSNAHLLHVQNLYINLVGKFKYSIQ